MNRVSRPIATVAVAAVAVVAWVVAANRIGSVSGVDLGEAERSVFSPAGQDGVLEKLFAVIEPTNRYLVDLGAGDGVTGSCSRNLIANHGWHGLLVEPRQEVAARLAANCAGNASVRTLGVGIYPGDIEIQFERAEVPRDLDLLIVGLSSNDWYVWRAIEDYRPKVVQIEYNAAFLPPQTMVIEYHPLNYWDGGLYFGASIQSLYNLGKRKGYELVYAERSGTSLYFVDRPYFDRLGLADNSPVRLFAPRPGFPKIPPDKVWAFMEEDGRFRGKAHAELVVEDVRVPRAFVVGEY